MAEQLMGASVWEQRIYDHVVDHAVSEREVLLAYQKLAEDTSSPTVRYLIGLILDDERRHHAMLQQLAETIRTSAEMGPGDTPIPTLDGLGPDRERLASLTQSFLDHEHADQQELQHLERELKPVRHTTLWPLVIQLLEHDNEKHIKILKFIRGLAREGS